MALLYSEKTKLGIPAPEFKLKAVDGKMYELADFYPANAVVVMFICNHCPYVKAIEDRIIQLQRDYTPRGINLAGICSNDFKSYPDDSPANLKKRWLEKDYRFPYLVDESQDVARAFGAVCTPDIFVFDSAKKLAYRGRLDDNWQEPAKVKKHDLREALDSILAGVSPNPDQHPSMGCSIKWIV